MLALPRPTRKRTWRLLAEASPTTGRSGSAHARLACRDRRRHRFLTDGSCLPLREIPATSLATTCQARLQTRGPLPQANRARFIDDCLLSTQSAPSKQRRASGGFNAAGAELNVSANAVGRLVKVLEDRVGVALFRRLPRGVVLTRAGHRYLGRVGTLLDQLAESTADLQRLETSRMLTVSAMPSMMSRWLIPNSAD